MASDKDLSLQKAPYHRGLYGTPNTALRSTLAFGALAGAAVIPLFGFVPLTNVLDRLVLGEAPNAAPGAFEVEGALSWTPGLFAASSLLPGLVVPTTLAIERFVYNKPWGSIFSTQGKFRWSWFLTVAKRVLPATAVFGACLHLYKAPGLPALSYRSLVTSASVALFMPLAAAAEEFGVRGLVTRVVSSWISDPDTAFWTSTGIASVLFAALHRAPNVWNNVYYTVAGVSASFIAHWSGGLEASTLVHSACNAMLTLPIVLADNKQLFDEYTSPKGMGPAILLPAVNIIGMAWLIKQLSHEKEPEKEQ